jgi:hypothetical protein
MSDSGAEEERDNEQWLQHARHGDYERAWQVSDRVLQRHVSRPYVPRPRHEQSIWRGQAVHGARVLVRCYHGLGDTLQFIRYMPMLHTVAREVIVWAQPSLLQLLEGVQGIDRLIPLTDGTPDVGYDVDVEVMELPFIFRTTVATIPKEIPYISLPASRLPGEPPRIGLAWRCGDWETRRSVPFENLRPLLELGAVTWCSMQQHRRPEESHANLVDASTDDIYEAARKVAALDLMITADSMPAHLAGALGVPVWTLLRQDADWRWMEERDDSPWYPTMRLFRQHREGDWADVIARVTAVLTASAAGALVRPR